MKKQIVYIAFIAAIAGISLTSCQTNSQKEEAAQENLQDAQDDLEEVKADSEAEAVKVADAEEWIAFKLEQNEKIKNNDEHIAELKIKLNKPGKVLDPIYEKRIETLQAKNADLKARMLGYEKTQTDWAKFKEEFNHDIDELGKSLKDFGTDNK